MRNEQTLLTPGEPDSSHMAPQTWDELFEQDARPRVWRKVALAAGLCSLGAVLLSIGLGLWFTGQGGQGASIALFVLGSLTFLPGFYHTRIAYLAWRGVSGYSFKDIPDF